MERLPITITTTIKAPLAKVWSYWTEPAHIVNWAFATADWHAPKAENDVRVGGTFKTVMAAKDGSTQFDFAGVYTAVEKEALIEYDMDDSRHVTIVFEEGDDMVKVTQTFDPETENDLEMQRQGWQAILDNFGRYVEENVSSD